MRPPPPPPPPSLLVAAVIRDSPRRHLQNAFSCDGATGFGHIAPLTFFNYDDSPSECETTWKLPGMRASNIAGRTYLCVKYISTIRGENSETRFVITGGCTFTCRD